MTHAELVTLLAQLGAHLENAARIHDPGGRCRHHLVLDATEAEHLRERILAALSHLGRVQRVPIQLEEPIDDRVDRCPIGMRVCATIYGPTELGRLLPGAAVIEVSTPPRKS